jgi:hypothetical protein
MVKQKNKINRKLLRSKTNNIFKNISLYFKIYSNYIKNGIFSLVNKPIIFINNLFKIFNNQTLENKINYIANKKSERLIEKNNKFSLEELIIGRNKGKKNIDKPKKIIKKSEKTCKKIKIPPKKINKKITKKKTKTSKTAKKNKKKFTKKNVKKNVKKNTKKNTTNTKKISKRPPVKESTKLMIYDMQNDKCALCSESLGIGRIIDHVLMRSLGGHDNINNYQGLCTKCNKWKTFHFDQFVRNYFKENKKKTISFNKLLDLQKEEYNKFYGPHPEININLLRL